MLQSKLLRIPIQFLYLMSVPSLCRSTVCTVVNCRVCSTDNTTSNTKMRHIMQMLLITQYYPSNRGAYVTVSKKENVLNKDVCGRRPRTQHMFSTRKTSAALLLVGFAMHQAHVRTECFHVISIIQKQIELMYGMQLPRHLQHLCSNDSQGQILYATTLSITSSRPNFVLNTVGCSAKKYRALAKPYTIFDTIQKRNDSKVSADYAPCTSRKPQKA